MKQSCENKVGLSARGLSYHLGFTSLFSQLNIQLEAGQVLQITGNNGSGKTTLLRILVGLLSPTEGEVCWAGRDIRVKASEFKRALLFLAAAPGAKRALTVAQNVQLMCTLRGVSINATEMHAALEKTGLRTKEHLRVADLSSGQLRRLSLCKLLLCSAQLWVLDEPFSAMDENGCNLLRTMMSDFVQQGGQIIMTSHQNIKLNNVDIATLNLDPTC